MRKAKPTNTENTNYITLNNGENVMMKRVPGFEDLWVNIDGTIAIENGTHRKIQKIITGKNKKPFTMIIAGKTRQYMHRIMALAFWGPSDKQYVIHLDGNTINNHYKNLAWASSIEKHYNQVSNGSFRLLDPKYSHSKIPAEDHPKIIERLKQGETLRKIAREYQTSDMSVHRLKVKYKLNL